MTFYFIFILFGFGYFSEGNANPAKAENKRSIKSAKIDSSSKKLNCSPKELEFKNCWLHQNSLKIQFVPEKILIQDQVWRKILPLPLFGSKVEWQSIALLNWIGQTFVEYSAWTEPFGETEVQNLKFYIYKIHNKDIQLVYEGIQQKRTRNFSFPDNTPANQNLNPNTSEDLTKGSPSKETYLYDKLDRFQFHVENGKVYIRFQNKSVEI
jgi:hypothetical protein